LAAFIDRPSVEACVERGCRERGPLLGVAYQAFVDMSGGRVDSSVLAVAHAGADGRGVLDVLRERVPPFSPDIATEEFAATCKIYGISRVVGDQYAGSYPGDAFLRHGISYDPAEKPRSGLYLDLLPLVNSSRIVLLDNGRLINQLCALERRIERSGRESVNHPDRGHDDLINAAAGVLTMVAAAAGGPMRARGIWELARRAAGLLSPAPGEPELEPDPLPVATGFAPGSTEWQAAHTAMLAVPPAQRWPPAAPAPQRCQHGATPGGCRQCLRQGRYVGHAIVTAISGGST
jgi:hypothetical protein